MKEPYSGKFINLDNTVLTPHIGSYSKEIRSRMEKEAIDLILKVKFKMDIILILTELLLIAIKLKQTHFIKHLDIMVNLLP